MQIRRISGVALACTVALTAGPVLSAYAEPTTDPTTEATASTTTPASAAPTPLVAAARASNAETCSTSPAQITIVNFNDFHGRIAAASPDTVGFFGQIESYRAAAGEANTLVLANGDSIGGSLFASFIQDDNPTIDILNAADLDATSAGNHEFDRGWDDLSGRVQDRADFPILGANVYNAGTTTPALPEYATFDKAGVKVAVIGAGAEHRPDGPAEHRPVDQADQPGPPHQARPHDRTGQARSGEVSQEGLSRWSRQDGCLIPPDQHERRPTPGGWAPFGFSEPQKRRACPGSLRIRATSARNSEPPSPSMSR